MESADFKFAKKKLSAIILAAGMSRRMGDENKLLLKHNSKTLLLETIDQISNARAIDQLIIVLGHEAEIIRNHIKGKDVKTIYNHDYKTGQTSSIQTGVKAAGLDTDGYMICLADMPFLKSSDYEALITFWNLADSNSIVRPFVNNKAGHPVIFNKIYRNDILTESYTEGCRTVIKKHQEQLVYLSSSNEHYLIDIDSPSDKDKLDY